MFFRIVISLILVTSLFASGAALAGAKIYVSGLDRTIKVYDQQTGVEEAIIAINGNSPSNLFTHPSGDYLFATTYTGSNLGYKIVKIDVAQNIQIEETVLTTSGPHIQGVTYSPMGDKVYFFQQPSRRNSPSLPVSTFDLNTMTLDTEIPMDFHVQSMTISPDGGQLFIMATNGTLRVIDTATSQTVSEENLGAGTDIQAMHPSGNTLYVNRQDNFHPVDTTTLELLPSIGDSSFLQAVVSEEYLFIDRLNTVDIINVGDYSLLGTIDLTQFGWVWARAMAFDSSTRKLSAVGMNYNIIESDLVIIDIPTLTVEHIVPTTRFPMSMTIKPDTVDVTLQVQGIDATTVQCSNNTTGQGVHITPQPTESTWNCEAHGLLVQPGDEVDINVIGTAQ